MLDEAMSQAPATQLGTMTMQRTLLAAAIVCTALATATPASAQLYAGYNDRQSYDFTLRSSDATFEARLRLAARQACGQRIGQVTLREWRMIRECKREFIESARATAA
jgi:UrcA family protein